MAYDPHLNHGTLELILSSYNNTGRIKVKKKITSLIQYGT